MDVQQEPFAILVQGLRVVTTTGAGEVAFPGVSAVTAYADSEWVLAGEIDGRPCLAAALADGAGLEAGLALTSVRALFDRVPAETLGVLGRAMALTEFEVMHRRCGRCGTPTERVAEERARRCPAGHGTFHPRIAPAVIVLVTRGDEMLLARNASFPPGRFSAVAGFVEIGESLEECARREVGEELGIQIDDLSYFRSQPWPYGRSLMMGFFARWAGGEVRVDGSEIVEAGWFARTHLPALPPPVSIARQLIDCFLSQPPRLS